MKREDAYVGQRIELMTDIPPRQGTIIQTDGYILGEHEVMVRLDDSQRTIILLLVRMRALEKKEREQ